MTLETTKTYRGKTRKFEVDFDPDILVGKIEFIERAQDIGLEELENTFSIYYRVNEIPELYPPNTTDEAPYNYIKIKGDNTIYWESVYYVPEFTEKRNPLKNYITYSYEAPEIVFKVKLTEEETKIFLLAVLKKFINGEAKKI